MKFDETKLVVLFSDKKKRKNLTSRQQIYFWENPRTYTRTCSICGERIVKISDVELDMNREFSRDKNGLALTHKACNRVVLRQMNL